MPARGNVVNEKLAILKDVGRQLERAGLSHANILERTTRKVGRQLHQSN